MNWLIFAITGYAVILLALMAWEGIGLISRRDSWPTITELVRAAPAWLRSFVVGVCAWMAGHFAGLLEGVAIAGALYCAGLTYLLLTADE